MGGEKKGCLIGRRSGSIVARHRLAAFRQAPIRGVATYLSQIVKSSREDREAGGIENVTNRTLLPGLVWLLFPWLPGSVLQFFLGPTTARCHQKTALTPAGRAFSILPAHFFFFKKKVN